VLPFALDDADSRDDGAIDVGSESLEHAASDTLAATTAIPDDMRIVRCMMPRRMVVSSIRRGATTDLHGMHVEQTAR
jgi:hypothetical protein